MELHNKYTLMQHICLNQGVPDQYMSIIPRMGDLFWYGLSYLYVKTQGHYLHFPIDI